MLSFLTIPVSQELESGFTGWSGLGVPHAVMVKMLVRVLSGGLTETRGSTCKMACLESWCWLLMGSHSFLGGLGMFMAWPRAALRREGSRTARQKQPCFKWLCFRSHTLGLLSYSTGPKEQPGCGQKGTTQECEHEEVRRPGGHEGWLPQSGVSF